MKSRRDVIALFFLLAAVLSGLASIGGGLVLVGAYSHPESSLPLWEFGKYVMILGLANAVVYVCLFWQIRAVIASNDS